MQKHWDVMRTDDAGELWHEISGNLPTDFGFPIDVHAHEPETVYVVPITSDSEHFPPDGKLRVYRSRTGGDEWEPLTKGLPQEHCYVNVLRDAMAVDALDACGVYFGTTGGQVYASADARRHLGPDRARPARRAVGGGADAAMIVACVLPAHLRTLARVDGEISVDVAVPVTQAAVLDALEARYPVLRGTIRDHATGRRRAFVRYFACEQDLSHEPPDAPLPEPVARGAEPLSSSGRWRAADGRRCPRWGVRAPADQRTYSTSRSRQSGIAFRRRRLAGVEHAVERAGAAWACRRSTRPCSSRSWAGRAPASP